MSAMHKQSLWLVGEQRWQHKSTGNTPAWLMAASEAGVAFVTFLKSAGLPEKLWSVLLQKVECGELGVDGQLKVLQESLSPSLITL